MTPAAETNDILERLYGDDTNKRAFLKHAARFFGRTETQSRLGLDAQALLHEAMAKITKTGFPDQIDNPAAYVMAVIECQGIQRVSRRAKNDKAEQERAASELAVSSPSEEEHTVERLTSAEVSGQVAEIVDQLPMNQKMFAEAKLADPYATDREIADQQGVSRSTVSRAKAAIHDNNELLDLYEHGAGPHDSDEPTTNSEKHL